MDKKAEIRKKMEFMDEPFQPKEEYSRIKFDPNIRHRMMDDMDIKTTYRALVYKEP